MSRAAAWSRPTKTSSRIRAARIARRGTRVGFSRTGGSTIDVIAPDATCRSVGDHPGLRAAATMTCTRSPRARSRCPTLCATCRRPPKPALPTPMVYPATTRTRFPPLPRCDAVLQGTVRGHPQTCKIAPSGGSKDVEWILSPGLYPGGLEVDARTARRTCCRGSTGSAAVGSIVKGDASIVTIATASDAGRDVATHRARPTTLGCGGVMIYNSKLPAAAAGEFTSIGSGATDAASAARRPVGDPKRSITRSSIFQDRTVTTPVTLNGSSSYTQVMGIIYVPRAR